MPLDRHERRDLSCYAQVDELRGDRQVKRVNYPSKWDYYQPAQNYGCEVSLSRPAKLADPAHCADEPTPSVPDYKSLDHFGSARSPPALRLRPTCRSLSLAVA